MGNLYENFLRPAAGAQKIWAPNNIISDRGAEYCSPKNAFV